MRNEVKVYLLTRVIRDVIQLSTLLYFVNVILRAAVIRVKLTFQGRQGLAWSRMDDEDHLSTEHAGRSFSFSSSTILHPNVANLLSSILCAPAFKMGILSRHLRVPRPRVCRTFPDREPPSRLLSKSAVPTRCKMLTMPTDLPISHEPADWR